MGIGMSLRIADIAQIASEMRIAVRIGIDGPGGSGKSTLAARLARDLLEADLVEGDDFFRPQSDPNRSETEVAGLFDLQRLASQVLIPHSKGRDPKYQRYSWESDALGDWVRGSSGATLIVEGVYSTHQALRDFHDLRIWVTSPREVRLSRGLERDGEDARSKWVDVWMPVEDRYIAEQAPQDHAHLVLDGSQASPSQAEQPLYVVKGGWLAKKP